MFRTLRRGGVPALFVSALLAACSQNGTYARPDAQGGSDAAGGDASLTDVAAVDTAPAICPVGEWRCNGSRQARRCDGRGGYNNTVDCPDGQQCIGGSIACGVCAPGEGRCDDSRPEQPQHCTSDGLGWEDLSPCNTTLGERCIAGACRDRCFGLETSYLGCEYWPTITPNSGLHYNFRFAVAIANPTEMDVHVQVEGGAFGTGGMRTLAPHAVQAIELPWVNALKGSTAGCSTFPPTAFDCQAHSTISTAASLGGAYHVRSDGPIAVYQFNPLNFRTGTGSSAVYSYTNDASLLLPQNVLADGHNQEYIVVTRPNWLPSDSSDSTPPYGGFVSVVATGSAESPTSVTVELTATVGDPRRSGSTLGPGSYTFMLSRGDVLQLVGTVNRQDLTGSVIRANGPIAVFAGHDCTYVPADRAACDHLEEQLFPAATWGRSYAVTFLRDRQIDPNEFSMVRVVSQADGNHLSFDGLSTPSECARTLDKGEFCEFRTSGNVVITGEQPILVAQYMVGQATLPQCTVLPGVPPPDSPDCVGDPAMVLEVPTEQYRDQYDILVPSSYTLSFVNVVAPRGSSIRMDGADLPAADTRGPFAVGSTHEVRIVRVPPGVHHFTGDGGARFGVKVYGVASYTSYMFPGGLDLAPINPPG